MVGVGYDQDAPGEEAAVKLATSLEAVGAFVFRVRPPEEVKDWNEALTTYGVMMTGAYIAMAVDQARSEFQCSHDFIDNLLVCIRRGIEAGELAGH
jgi:DNA primase